jgi:DNA-binding beta-propeller fold protein YncE
MLALILAAGCSSREHANPFDPQNPLTRGRPAGFAALAGSQLVQLRWTPPVLSGEFAFRLYRRGPGDADFKPIGSDLASTTSLYYDFGLQNGATYDYRLYFVFSGVTGGFPAEDVAVPGPLRPWCADLSLRTLSMLTPDGRHIASQTGGFFGPTHVAVDPTVGSVWLSDTYDGRVVILDPTTGVQISIRGLAEPVAIALDPIDQSAWVCDQARDTVYHYIPSGRFGTPAKLGGIQTPIGVATDPTSGAVWVCSRDGNQVLRYTRTGSLLGSSPLRLPSRVAVDSLTGDAWVTSLGGQQLVSFSSAGTLQTTVPLSGPIGVAVDPRRNRIWVADAVAGQVVSVRRGGAIEFRVGGMPQAGEIAVDLATGEAWVAVPGNGTVARISATGAVLARLTGFSDPYGIALDPGSSRGLASEDGARIGSAAGRVRN